MAATHGPQNPATRLLRPFAVRIHQCECGYASVYRQKIRLHSERCGRPCAELDRVVPADDAVAEGRRVACDSEEEEQLWTAVVADRQLMDATATMSIEAAIAFLFAAWKRRARNVHTRGNNVLEFRGPAGTTATPMAKFCKRAAYDIARRLMALQRHPDPRARALYAESQRVYTDDDDAEEEDGVEHRTQLTLAEILQHFHLRKPPKLGLETLEIVTAVYDGIERAARAL